MKKIKVILSTNGPLHLIKSAEYLVYLVDIRVIQGWIPKKIDKFLINIISKIVGRDLSKSLKKRTPECLKGKNISVALPEFYFWFRKYFFMKNSVQIPIQTANIYGFLSKKYISNADIFHVRSGSGLGGAISKAKQEGMKVIVDHSIAHPSFMDYQLRDEYKKNGEIFSMGMDTPFWKGVLNDCKEADYLLVNSDFVKKTFVKQGYDEKKIRVVYLGVRKDFFYLKKEYQIYSRIKILFTGSFGFRKGGEYLLRALQELDKKKIEYEMIVVGTYMGAENLIEKYKSNHIQFIGHVHQDELKKYLSECDIYLFPSLCEGCASSGLEAMAAGLPVITTIESGLPILDGVNGIIIPSKSIEAIVNAIMRLYLNKNLRQDLGMTASQTISMNFTWNQYAEKVVEVYEDVLKK